MHEKVSLKELVKKLPNLPGVYIMKNKDDKIIYIGKAKNLKNRVSSYFNLDSNHSSKVREMVKNIESFDYIITDSEFEALVLECSLIKKHQPKYNILLKDDKGYSYIKITNDIWPRVKHVKQKVDNKAIYIGPYMNSFIVKKIVEEVTKIFKLPTCSRNFLKIYKRPCLNYHINICAAPCIRAISHERYLNTIKDVKKFIKSGSSETVKYLKEKMVWASENLNFEYAAELRDRIKSIEDIKNKQKVVAYKKSEVDVIALAIDEASASVEVFKFQNGDLYETQNFIVEPENDAISTRTEFLKQYYMGQDDIPRNIMLDDDIQTPDLIEKFFTEKFQKRVNITVPKRGDDLKLIEMCKNNAYESLIKSKRNKNRYEDILEDLKNILSLKNKPRYIEAYDISNLSGTDNVGGMVAFKNARPYKSDYRRFKIKSVIGQDDYSSMKEILARRIDNYMESGGVLPLPDLILVDGGISHTKAVKDVLNAKKINIPVFGMVKDGKHRTRAITTEGYEISIKSNTRVFSFITSVQDEVHRYTINYHKKLRDKKVKTSELTKILGIGEKRAKLLLKFFGSVDKISKASKEELSMVNGMNSFAAQSVYEYFHKV